ncbi:MAG: HIT family protein [Christensenellales bacterium]|jgi:diadenosine tetraphosphate (Ap4A) HIT family hydrolase
MFGRLLIRIARMDGIGALVSFLLRHVSRCLPIKRLYEDARLIAFRHPAPSADPHILIVPKARMRTARDVSDAMFADAARTACMLAAGHAPLEMRINGGARQEVMQVHFHLLPMRASRGRRMRIGDVGRIEELSARIQAIDAARGYSIVFDLTGGGIFYEEEPV